MDHELVKNFAGRGRLYDGSTFLAEAVYDINVYDEFRDSGDMARRSHSTKTTRSISGTVEALPGSDAFIYGDDLRLEMNDGATLKFFFEGSGSTIIANGAIRGADGTPMY
jgi:hypothetical protein